MPAKKSTTRSRKTKKAKNQLPPPKRREIGALVCIFLAVFAFLGLFTYEKGVFIDFFGVFIKGLIGAGFYISIPALLLAAFILGFHRGRPVRMRLICTLLLPLIFGALLHILYCDIEYEWKISIIRRLYEDGLKSGVNQSGGVFGGLLALLLKLLFSKAGAIIVFVCTIVFLCFASLNISIPAIIDWYKNRPRREYVPEDYDELRSAGTVRRRVRRSKKERATADEGEYVQSQYRGPANKAEIDIPVDDPPNLPPEKPSFFDPNPKVKTPDQVLKEVILGDHMHAITSRPHAGEEPAEAAPESAATEGAKKSAKVSAAEAEKAREEVTEDIEKKLAEVEPQKYIFPPIDLLKKAPAGSMVDGREEMALNAKRLTATISSFGINAKICGITRGPSVTRYEVELERGVKLSKLTKLSDDIALSLGATGVRIAPVPEKISIVGIEVPNKTVNIVHLREIIESREFKRSSSSLTFSIGKDIAGTSVVGDIAGLPHLLIAGTTGSGKSVCMNSLIISLMYKSSPEDVRLIMIDPKMIELGIYNGIPHLLIPVVTDPKKAAGALQWAEHEMMKRYSLIKDKRARDLESYNKIVQKEGGQKLPKIVILIDELADLMLVAAKEVEGAICRIAAMGRASGMHLVIATQRPSADLITGLMKDNIPSRNAFAVDSALNSRIILDNPGAEKLIGKGDMLYFPTGVGKPQRVQGTFITDKEREDVIEFVKESSKATYSEEIIKEIEKASGSKGSASASGDKNSRENEADELLEEAVEVALEAGQVSVSMLQRRLKLGYSRAARLVDQMEERGYVGPFEGSKPRQLMITRAQWNAMQGKGDTIEEDGFDEDDKADEDMEEEE